MTRLTTITKNHRHKWSPKARFTSYSDGHKHRIRPKQRKTYLSGKKQHIHKLIMRIVK